MHQAGAWREAGVAKVGEDERRVGPFVGGATVCRETEEDVCGFDVPVEDGRPFGGGWRPLRLVPVVAVMKEGNRFREFEEAVPNEGFWDGKLVRMVVCRKYFEITAVAVVIIDLGSQRRNEELSELEDSVVGGEDVCENAHLMVEGSFRFEDFAGHEFAAHFLSDKVDLSIAPLTNEP